MVEQDQKRSEKEHFTMESLIQEVQNTQLRDILNQVAATIYSKQPLDRLDQIKLLEMPKLLAPALGITLAYKLEERIKSNIRNTRIIPGRKMIHEGIINPDYREYLVYTSAEVLAYAAFWYVKQGQGIKLNEQARDTTRKMLGEDSKLAKLLEQPVKQNPEEAKVSEQKRMAETEDSIKGKLKELEIVSKQQLMEASQALSKRRDIWQDKLNQKLLPEFINLLTIQTIVAIWLHDQNLSPFSPKGQQYEIDRLTYVKFNECLDFCLNCFDETEEQFNLRQLVEKRGVSNNMAFIRSILRYRMIEEQ